MEKRYKEILLTNEYGKLLEAKEKRNSGGSMSACHICRESDHCRK